jgi:hypothetical protein
VVLSRDPIVAKSQWVDWDHVRKQKRPSLHVAIETCQCIGVYELMQFQHPWNTKVIA